jgi:hypothetical protein
MISGQARYNGKELKNYTKCNSLKPIEFIISAIYFVQNHVYKVISTCVKTLFRFKNFAYYTVPGRVAAGAASKFFTWSRINLIRLRSTVKF